jgi:two-component system cell cycle sensor histidine kinase/response regulator CckA
LGCEVETVTDGQTALQRYQAATAEKRPFDFLVMDLTIPGGMGGLEAIRQLKQMDPAVKAIVSSGYSDDPVMADYQAYGFTGVILKPYNLDQVKGAVRPYLNA